MTTPGRDHANIGRRLRELRLERGAQQSEVARQLGVSAAYLNLIEKGKRPMQLPLLWKALAYFKVEMDEFMASLGGRRAPDVLAELMNEPLWRSLGFPDEDLAEFSGEPRRTAMLVALFNLYKNTRTQLDALQNEIDRLKVSDGAGSGPRPGSLSQRFGYSPFEEVTDFLQAHRNHFSELEDAATRIRRDHRLGRRIVSDELVKILRAHKVKVEFGRPGPGGESSVVRRYDPSRRVLGVSTDLLEQPLKFQLAATIGLRVLDQTTLDERLARDFAPRHAETERLIKIHLANYFAGALLLPYGEFMDEVERTRYDVELLSDLFEMSYEAVAHRLCNLGDPRRPGLPMHFLRCDIAGNISKRYAATGLRFPEAGTGSCAKWAVHNAFLTPSVIRRQYSVMPDGSTYFCFAKVVVQPREGSVVRGTTYSIGLGVSADDARHLAYAQDMPLASVKMAVPVGVTCRLCERTDCNQRAAPSLKFAFNVDANTKKDNFFSPLLEHESPATDETGEAKPAARAEGEDR
jgi:hypothetical protein